MSAASPAAASGSSPDAPKASILGRSLSAADVKITRLARMLSVTSQLDTFLLTTTYTVHLVHAILARATKARLERAAAQLAQRITEKAPEALLPGETLIATVETAPSSRLLRAEQSTQAFNKVLDEFRMFMRLRNLPNLWTWGSGVLRRPAADATLQAIAVTQVTACVAFQGLENWAYLCSKGVFAAEPRRIGRAFLWAARCWMLHVVLEFVRLARVRQLRVQRALEAGADEKEATKVTKKEVETWWRELRINLAWMPLTVHWSMEGGYAGEAFVASLAGFAGWTNLIHQWRNTP